MTYDFWLGACWTLLCVTMGVFLYTLILSIHNSRGNPPSGPPEMPEPPDYDRWAKKLWEDATQR